MADKQLEDIEFRQDFIEKDSSSPLHLIREKEMEISGRVLKAKREAEDVVSDARRKAADVIAKAEESARSLAQERQDDIETEYRKEVETFEAASADELKAMKGSITSAKTEAVDAVVQMVTSV